MKGHWIALGLGLVGGVVLATFKAKKDMGGSFSGGAVSGINNPFQAAFGGLKR